MSLLAESVIVFSLCMYFCYFITHYLMSDDIEEVICKLKAKTATESMAIESDSAPTYKSTCSAEFALLVILINSLGWSFLVGFAYYCTFR